MSFFSDKDPEACWVYFERHLTEIPNDANRDAVRQYLREREENATYSTLGCYLGHIKAFGIYLDERGWLDAERIDVINHIKDARGQQGRVGRRNSLRGKPLGKYTKYQRMVMLREFYKWLLDTEATPEAFRRMPFVKPTLEEQYSNREERLTQDEVLDMLAATDDAMERALVALLLDGGFRAGEASAFNIGDAKFDSRGVRMMHSRTAKGLKTLRRNVPVRLTWPARYLREWISKHPHRLHPEWPLFISRSRRNEGARLSAGAVWGIITRLAKKAKIRHVHPHMFRQTAASLRSADGWNEEMMRLHFGWSKGSDMPSYYANVEEDYDNFALRRAGIPVERPKAPEWTQQCPHCRHENGLETIFCDACDQPLRSDD